jgi:monoterpene epsilon-lactone hydrolase
MATRGLSRRRMAFQASLLRSVTLAAARRALRGPRHPSWTFAYELVMAATRDAMRRDHEGSARMMRRQVGKVPSWLAARVTESSETLAGIPCAVHTPRDHRPSDPTLLYLHGGGYVTCSPATHRELIARLALASGARCVAPDYRLAPEHPFPAALEDALSVHEAVRARGVPARGLFIAGDSAGAGLAVATLLALRDKGLPLPRAALLLSPWVDLSLDARALSAHGPLDYLNAKMLSETAPKYAAATSLSHPLVSPIYADLAGLPPLFVQTGAWEVFFDQNVRFVAKARADGVQVRHDIADGLLHVFAAFAGLQPEAKSAIAELGAYVRTFTVEARGSAREQNENQARGSAREQNENQARGSANEAKAQA